jgi:2-dehydro-3-deoxyphosphogluconate aldolase/(4S)-4-hydroxy-2-oxoglutarate aldolase
VLIEGGLPVMEIALRTPAANAAIEAVRSSAPDAIVGAAPSWRPVSCRRDRGGGGVRGEPGIERRCCSRPLPWCGVPFVPGVATTTELMRVVASGASRSQVLPAEASGGLATVSSLAAVAPSVRFLPTGGIDGDSARIPGGRAGVRRGRQLGVPRGAHPRDGLGPDRRARTRGVATRDRAAVTRVLIVGEPLVE